MNIDQYKAHPLTQGLESLIPERLRESYENWLKWEFFVGEEEYTTTLSLYWESWEADNGNELSDYEVRLAETIYEAAHLLGKCLDLQAERDLLSQAFAPSLPR